MLPEDQEGRLRCYRNALRNWNFRGYVRLTTRAEEWILSELGVVSREVAHELYRHVEAGGEIDEQEERRPEYIAHEFHYDLRVNIGGRRVYFETVLIVDRDADDPDDPTILVVSVHDV
jgi:hypothetical protein